MSIHFYDENRNPLEPGEILSQNGIFLIAELPTYSGDNVVGLFIGDDDNFFLKTTFSAYWLGSLRITAACGESIKGRVRLVSRTPARAEKLEVSAGEPGV